MKSLLYRNIAFAAVGAIVAWLISEPWSANHSYGRDMFIMICLGFFVWFFLSTANFLYFRKFSLLTERSQSLMFGFIPIVGAIVVKIILTPGQSVAYNQDLSVDGRVLLLDVSSSMQGEPILELKRAVKNYLETLENTKSRDYISIVTFSDDAELVTEFTNNYQRLGSDVISLRAQNGTNMESGLQLSAQLLSQFQEKNPGFGNEILLVSDGQPNDEMEVRSFVANRLQYSCTTIGVGDNYDLNLLNYIATTTNGKFYQADKVNELNNTFQKIASGNLTAADETNKSMSIWRRIIGWGLLGLSIGLGIGLFEKHRDKIIIGVAGGILGGVIGAFCLQIIGLVGLPGFMGRLISFVVFAIVLAVFLWLTEQLYTIIKPFSTQRKYPHQY